jgi:cell division transport system permease protein
MTSRLRLLGAEAVRSIGANLSTTVAATMTVLIGMFLLGLSIALGSWVLAWSGHVKEELQVRVFFDQNATAQQINTVRERLAEQKRLVRSMQFVSKRQALQRMERRRPDLVRNLAYNPFPPSFEVQPRKGEFVEDIGTALLVNNRLPPAVDKICPAPPDVKLPYKSDDCGRTVTRRVLKVAKIVEVVFFVAVIVLLISAALLIGNTIRLSIFARRREIEVMKLVGATNWFVRGPFVLEGLIVGFLGAVAAVILLALGKELVLPAVHVASSSDVHPLPFSLNALILLGMGLVLGAAGSGLTIRRFLQV